MGLKNGFIQLVVIILILLGLSVGLVLIQKQTKLFARATSVGPNHVLIGDSIAEGYPNWRADINAGKSGGYLSSEVGGNEQFEISYWLEQTTQQRWINSGRASDTASLVLTRLYDHAIRYVLNNNGVVVLNVGVNDLSLNRSYQDYEKDLDSILSSLKDAKAQLILVDIGPGNSLTSDQSKLVTVWNNNLKEWSIRNSIPLVSHHDVFGQNRASGDANNLWNLIPDYSYDGLHLSINGAKKLAELINQSLITSPFNTACAREGGRCGTFKSTTVDGYTCLERKTEFDSSCPKGGVNPQPYCFTQCSKPSNCASIGGKCATFKATTADGYVCKTYHSEFNKDCIPGGINPYPYCFTDCELIK